MVRLKTRLVGLGGSERRSWEYLRYGLIRRKLGRKGENGARRGAGTFSKVARKFKESNS